ncbi:hypothetical protein VPH35_062204 [Triticum aestivum]|uniref:Uncharacterized protein n=1 Tax=Aegilops tauschii subsp. strangulata TaxID=200361 RepID=A0A453G8Q0_AEGTS
MIPFFARWGSHAGPPQDCLREVGSLQMQGRRRRTDGLQSFISRAASAVTRSAPNFGRWSATSTASTRPAAMTTPTSSLRQVRAPRVQTTKMSDHVSYFHSFLGIILLTEAKKIGTR